MKVENDLGSLDRREEQWPPEHLEHLGCCPICSSKKRKLLCKELTDDVFKCAAGSWTVYHCIECGNGYLDPRPDLTSIGDAYASYYTHTPAAHRPSVADTSPQKRFLRGLANGYRNWRYGTTGYPSIGLGAWLFRVLVPFRRLIDREFRYLPRKPGRLLDVGFGSGRFLDDAQLAGWATVGIDFDPITVRNAALRGHEVAVGGIELYDARAEEFDVISLSHVIEHVHDPARTLRDVLRLLRPGGQLWLDTPNLGSSGRRWFGNSWRGWEIPRHLVIFEARALVHILEQTGFEDIRWRVPHAVAFSMFAASNDLRSKPLSKGVVRLMAVLAIFISFLKPSRAEFITLTARRPVGTGE